MIPKNIKPLLLIIWIISISLIVHAKGKNPEDLFSESGRSSINQGVFDVQTPLHITLKYDVTSFIKTKHKGS